MPVGNQGHELIIVILTLVVLTFLALSLAKCLRKKVRTVRCYINKDTDKKKKKKKNKKSKDQSDDDEEDDDEDAAADHDEHISDEDLNAYRESFIQPSSDPNQDTISKKKKARI